MPRESISKYNETWGICGFTSAFTHLYTSDVRLQNQIDTKTPQTIRMGMLVEVLTFLKYVRAFRRELIPGLTALNKKLASPLMQLGIEQFIREASLAVRRQNLIGASNYFQCAMTAEALTLYVQVICGIPTATLTNDADPGGQGILGIMNKQDELVHWVYRDVGGRVYNWGAMMTPQEWETDAVNGLKADGLHHVGCHVSLA